MDANIDTAMGSQVCPRPTSLTAASKIYPLNGSASAKPMIFPDASGVPVNMLPISDGSAFDQLKLLTDSEGDNLAGADWLGMLAAIGIVKDKPFTPDAHTQEGADAGASRRLAKRRAASSAGMRTWRSLLHTRKCEIIALALAL